jgi:uncharacterized protein
MGMVERLRKTLAALVAAPIRLYQRLISPALPARCKYAPTCSAYAISAIRSFGVLRGSVLAGWRLLRCNPFSHGGYDPVEAQTLFRRGRARGDAPIAASSDEHEHEHEGVPA